VPARTVSRILRRLGVPRLAICDPMTGEVIRASKTTAVRYERGHPGELVHMDVKKIGRIPDGGGSRAHGREMGSSWARKKIKVGYDYVHSVVDDHSRFAYSEILPDEKATTNIAFFERALDHFAAHRVTIQAVMTDNAWNYTHSIALSDLLERSGIDHLRIKAHCPWQNGKSSDSTARCKPSGPTARCSPTTKNAPPHLHPGSTTTTLADATPPSAATHP
jgi:transposase InsO family protein